MKITCTAPHYRVSEQWGNTVIARAATQSRPPTYTPEPLAHHQAPLISPHQDRPSPQRNPALVPTRVPKHNDIPRAESRRGTPNPTTNPPAGKSRKAQSKRRPAKPPSAGRIPARAPRLVPVRRVQTHRELHQHYPSARPVDELGTLRTRAYGGLRELKSVIGPAVPVPFANGLHSADRLISHASRDGSPGDMGQKGKRRCQPYSVDITLVYTSPPSPCPH